MQFDRNIWRALITISHQIYCVEKKLNLVLENIHPDFSKEDRAVKRIAKKVVNAQERIPHEEKQQKGKTHASK